MYGWQDYISIKSPFSTFGLSRDLFFLNEGLLNWRLLNSIAIISVKALTSNVASYLHIP